MTVISKAARTRRRDSAAERALVDYTEMDSIMDEIHRHGSWNGGRSCGPGGRMSHLLDTNICSGSFSASRRGWRIGLSSTPVACSFPPSSLGELYAGAWITSAIQLHCSEKQRKPPAARKKRQGRS